MFQRRASQKPSDDLMKNFKASFPRMNPGDATTATSSAQDAAPVAQALQAAQLHTRHEQHANHEVDPVFRGNDQWSFGASGFTPSMMDPNSQSFNIFASQMHGYYTPTPGGTNTLYHSQQAGDLHTPGFGLGLGTPLSLPTSEHAMHAGQQLATASNFQANLSHGAPQPGMQSFNPFQMHQQHAFQPQHFGTQPSYEDMEAQDDDSPMDTMAMDAALDEHHTSPELLFHPQSLTRPMPPPPFHPSADKFRFHVTLNAQTAMTKHSDEIPVTYLNKGQAYTLNVVDTTPQQSALPARYRTFVRVSFEDEEQRQKPASCWQLWKEGRGTNEAHQRGGKLQAVEFVETGQPSGAEDPSKPVIELESYSFDGFCVVWSPPNGGSECPLSVRFNFLSTDFSHSKGVKGVPVRLCAKTEALSSIASAADQAPEVCYCKVKLFRDHGAERKLSNDVAHVKKTIDKLNQQIAQVESGMKDLGKRKRSGSIAKGAYDPRPSKIPKHKRTWSTASMTSPGARGSADDGLHAKLANLQDMFSSTRPASVLYLKGDAQDDPDLFPVRIPGEGGNPPLRQTESIESSAWDRQSPNTGPPSSIVSPVPSAKSLPGSRRDAGMQQPTPVSGPSRMNSIDARPCPQTAFDGLDATGQLSLASPPEHQSRQVPKLSRADSAWIEAVGMDPTYQPPPESRIKPAACFYVKLQTPGKPPQDFYRAIYLMQRSLKDFVNAVSLKFNREPTQVHRTVRVTVAGITVLLDDELVRELPEGQDMVAEFVESTLDPDADMVKPKREWDAGATDIQCDGDLSNFQNISFDGYELRLHF